LLLELLFLPERFDFDREDLLLDREDLLLDRADLLLDADFFDPPLFDAPLLEALFFEAPFFFGTFAPSFLASESPIAIACFLLFTFFPDRPDLSFPCFFSCIARSTFFCAPFEYLAI